VCQYVLCAPDGYFVAVPNILEDVYDPNNIQQLNALRSLGNVKVKRLHCRGCFMDALSANFFGNSEVKRATETSLSCLYVMGHCLDTRVSTSIHVCFIELD
jgi:hypothetical protein